MRWTLNALLVIGLAGLCCPPAFGRGGGGCLAGGTPILTPTGSIAIEALSPGDPVLSVSHGVLQTAIVTGVAQVEPAEFIDIDLPDERIEATPEHPFETAPDHYIAAGRLHEHDTLIRWDGRQLVGCSIVAIHRVHAARPAYNLTVMPGETFLAAGVVVHNKGCFLPDTPVLRHDGTSTAISTIRAGDRVLAFDDDRRPVPSTVLDVVSLEVDGYLQLTTDRVTLSVTDEHPFLVGEGRFVTADALHPGDTVYAFDGHGLVPQTVRSIRPVAGRVRVYNLRTNEPHTYFAAGIAVHNKGGGGGGGHGGGGGFGHIGGWGGHGRGNGNDDLSPLCCVSIALAFTAYVCFFVWVAAKKKVGGFGSGGGGVELDYVHPVSAIRPKAVATRQALAQLALTDRSFDPDALQSLTRDTFARLQACWQSQNYTPMQPLLTPGLYEQHLAQLAAMKDQHEINRIDSLNIESVDLVHVHYNPADNRPDFTALITARARDYYVDSRTQKFLRGDRPSARFQEFWTFGHNDHGWVLRRIEQSRESNKLAEPNSIGQPAPPAPPGPWADDNTQAQSIAVDALLAEWSQTDPTWDRGRLIDRVSGVFTTTMLAGQGGKLSIPKTFLTPTFATVMEAEAKQAHEQQVRMEMRNFDVRHVDLVIARRRADASGDEVIARVAAHCQTIVTRAGVVVRRDPDVRAFIRYCLFRRYDNAWKLHAILTPPQADEQINAGNVDEYIAET